MNLLEITCVYDIIHEEELLNIRYHLTKGDVKIRKMMVAKLDELLHTYKASLLVCSDFPLM